MTEAEILALTYYDKMNVYRPFKDTLPSGESVFKEGLDGKKVYEDISCALSSYSGGKAYKNNVNVKVESDFKLFYDPALRIEKNDTIECFHEGSRYILQAGKQHTFPSHAELPVNDTGKTA